MADEDERASRPRPGSQAHDYATLNTSTASTTNTLQTMSSGLTSPQSTEPAAQSSSQAEETLRRERPRARPVNYGSMQGSSTGRSQMSVTQSSQQTPKRPSIAKRMPSSVAPHRGEKFSVDDDPDEVDEDLRLARTQSKQDTQRERQLWRRESTVRRRAAAQPTTLPSLQSDESEDTAQVSGNDAAPPADSKLPQEIGDPSSEETLQGDDDEDDETPTPDEEDEADLSDAESFTLKDRQEAINETHPFGIRIWKPALYKKSRSVQKTAEGDIHSAPGGNVTRWIWIFNGLWTVVFGWWLCLITATGGIVCLTLGIFQESGSPGCQEYGRVLINLAHYLFYPFGKYIRLERDEAYLHEDEGEGRDISEYERWQAGDLEEGRLFFGPTDINRSIIGRRRDEVPDLEENETDSLLGRQPRQSSVSKAARLKTKKRLFGRGKWNIGRVVFFLSFYLLISPCLFLVSGICWFLVFTIPMGKVTLLLFYHLRRHPLAMSFHTDSHYARVPSQPRGSSDSMILLCTYRAVGLKYWKYTIDGTNIFLINLLGLVFFTIVDYFILSETLGIKTWLTSPGLVFVLALASIIPLAYFIGQAVASISAQSSMGVGATLNAFFSTIVEVFLYCIALKDGKSALVEGSVIGSIFVGILFLPGLSMCFGALKRKTQRFNVKSAGVTSTMLLFAVIALFGPTLFYQIYGSHILNCRECLTFPGDGLGKERDCRRCYFSQTPEINDRFFIQAVRPYTWFATVCLFLSYIVGLLFTLRTHAAVIWNNEPDEKHAKMEHSAHSLHQGSISVPNTAGLVVPDAYHPKSTAGRPDGVGTLRKEDIRDSQMYKRILNQSLKSVGINQTSQHSAARKESLVDPKSDTQLPYIVPPKSAGEDVAPPTPLRVPGLSIEAHRALVHEVAEIAATAAAVAARDATKNPKRASLMATTSAMSIKHSAQGKDSRDGSASHTHDGIPSLEAPMMGTHEEPAAGGHDAPNWSRAKSAVILLVATVAYAIIAEILVDTVDTVLSNIDIDEKFLGITLFALVPNTTEFLNAISFAMNGNVALSMEIGSSYTLQVILLQIPCLVLFSGVYTNMLPVDQVQTHGFALIFPQWDMVTVILGVFLMGWVVGEGKSNYFKGSILIFTYLVVVVGFYFSGYGDPEIMGIDRFDTLALGVRPETFRTIGQSSRGRAF